MTSETGELPLFPLHTVLFPGGPLSLRIFEPRYLDMVRDCVRQDSSFGVCLIRDGVEAGPAAEIVDVGTLARIVDWNRLEDGLLGVTAMGQGRFRVLERRVRSDELVVGRIERLPEEPHHHVPDAHQELVGLVQALLDKLHPLYADVPRSLDDATWIGYRLAELLPLPLSRKQYFLELEDPLERLRQIDEAVRSMIESDKGA
ncbi:MAG: peptidase S16 [Gammaproteobacteria bacterium]|nr:peptidase S16 [Gammaproteobacteria bacterium]NIR82087.1 peptidase S16 [Gammaproteobacteria bacterium]NIR89320.1 peptidase S16 [Gammaproteobacteria bacterium]NIU03197.1 peptidase S16 [Gammaproteobacteria bacterium]NIV50709.1 peptidase S16 [Gammaproteobacteria bacterium]